MILHTSEVDTEVAVCAHTCSEIAGRAMWVVRAGLAEGTVCLDVHKYFCKTEIFHLILKSCQ